MAALSPSFRRSRRTAWFILKNAERFGEAEMLTYQTLDLERVIALSKSIHRRVKRLPELVTRSGADGM